MNILVIGSTGFLGKKIVEFLNLNKFIVGHFARKKPKEEKDNPFFFEGDITKRESLFRPIIWADIVIMNAGLVSYNKKDAEKLRNIHVKGTRNVVDITGKKEKKLIYTSSAAVLGPSLIAKKEDELSYIHQIRELNSAYFLTKYVAENIVAKSELDAIILRPGSLIGNGKTSTSKIIDAVKKGFTPDFKGGASFADVSSVAESYVASVRRLLKRKSQLVETFNLGGENLKFSEFIDKIKLSLNKKTISVPYSLLTAYTKLCDFSSAFGNMTSEALSITDNFFFVDSGKAISELGYKITPVEKIISENHK
ncbi:MAG: NAD-dependent epimerase/dehydratase family protein [archaeon]